MPFVELKNSPHADGISSPPIHYRDIGSGPPVIFLHGGWGYGVYPIDRQIEMLASEARFLIPDRSGHGRSASFPGDLPIDFHQRAAEETLLVLDALKIDRAVFWGHSDGAVIATLVALKTPDRCTRLILEAFHLYRTKPRSRGFFQRFAHHPDEVSEKLQALLAADHGPGQWKNVVQRNCRVWLEFAAESKRPDQDLYDSHLSEVRVPVTFLHGRGDPRTEPDEIEAAQRTISGSELRFLEHGRHSPHSENACSREFSELLGQLIRKP